MKVMRTLALILTLGATFPVGALTLQEWALQTESNPHLATGYFTGVIDTIYNTSPDNMDYAECILERSRDGAILHQLSEWMHNEEEQAAWLTMPAPLVIRLATMQVCPE